MARLPAAKRRRLSPPDDDDSASDSPNRSLAKSSFANSKWDLEQDYENRPRSLNKKKEANRLPIKTQDGRIEQVHVAEPEKVEGDDDDSFLGTSSDEDSEEDEGEEDEVVVEAPKKSARQQIMEAKEELARLAELINEDPEEHVGVLKQLAELASSDNVTVKKLALATQAAVYKDIIPGYRIRPLTDDALKEKLSKEVRRLRNFEQAIVHGYQDYVRDLAQCAKGSKPGSSDSIAGLATVAISCACNLLTSVPHFNFRGDIIKILVDKLSTRSIDGDFVRCRETLEKVFEDDEDGNVSLDAVTMITKMLKGRNYNVHESVLNTFLHLRLLSEFSSKGSYDRIDKPEEDQPKGKKPKEKREFRTKKQRKIMKEQKAIEKEMKEADAAVSHEERDRMQAETLKLVFVAYFRILKSRSPSLMGAVLEGLARYAHLINQDFFGDILEALKDLINDAESLQDQDEEDDEDDENSIGARNATRESLLCVITAFALLQGQDASKAASTLHLDLNFFITHLYRTLYPVSLNPDIELGANSLHLPDPNNPHAHQSASSSAPTNKVNVQTTTVLLLRSLSSVLLPATAIRAVPPMRVAAFSKQLMTASLHLPEKSCLAMVSLLSKVAKVHGRKIAPLWHTEERKGDGVFNPLGMEIESSNPFATTVWEGEILRWHFCPDVREGLAAIEKGVVEGTK
ncbi:CCAAT-binding factor [Lasiodiplodia theobromae]|uniref:Nuclear export protein noc3 n=1 Tax=Lasiodiplodia theobromae TaxID=45133 RepID=UPI0015C3F084|nr:Nuclear export protein noc3 [Lasiodiplodia theobromae]KAF4538824.1 Nuclear export protein noc3 [Lasiodiplodia theobromae]KAF9637488.1 CCAAT-binding factor [Lasiodiplodia theobromae]